MDPFEAYWRLRLAIPQRPELRFHTWPETPFVGMHGKDAYSWLKPYQGACQIAAHVFCHLVEGSELWLCTKPLHFWSALDGKIWDTTPDQFSKVFDYSRGLQVIGWKMEERSLELLKECLSIDTTEQNLLPNSEDRQLALL